MRVGPIVHGVLLVAALAFAYQTWTREKTEETDIGEHIVWEKSADAVQAVVFDSERKSVRVERRSDDSGEYLWGEVKRSRPAPPETPDAAETPAEGADEKGADEKGADEKGADEKGADASEADAPANDKAKSATDGKSADDAKSKAADGDAPAAETADAETADDEAPADETADAPEPELITTTRQFPIGETGDELFSNLATLRALRDLGVLSEEQKEEYGLNDATDNLTVIFSDDTQKSMIVGKRIYGGADRYVLNPEDGIGYVISTQIMRPLDSAETSLGLSKVHAFEDDEVAGVTVKTKAGDKKLVKTEAKDDETNKSGGWAYADKPDEPDLTLANFLDRAGRLKPTEYDPELTTESLTHIATLSFSGKDGGELGSLEIFRQLPEDQPEDAGKSSRDGIVRTEYWVRSEETRVLGKVSRMAAERVDHDLVEIFGIEPGPDTPDEPPPPPHHGPHGMPGAPGGAPGAPGAPGAHGPHGAPGVPGAPGAHGPHGAPDAHGHGAPGATPPAKRDQPGKATQPKAGSPEPKPSPGKPTSRTPAPVEGRVVVP